MPRLSAILFLLTFLGNYFTVCHCSATPAAHRHPCCCKHMPAPCKDKDNCPAAHAVKFNLLDKQVAAVYHSGPIHVVLVSRVYVTAPASITIKGANRAYYDYRHSPPDRQAFLQQYLI